MAGPDGGDYSFLELHCHSAASYDSLSRPLDIVRVAASRGLTHVAITDHERIDAAVAARDAVLAAHEGASSLGDGPGAAASEPPRVTVIVGEEIRSTDGDVIALFIREAIPAGLSGLETIQAVHEQGGVAGIPHPFDRFRFSGLAGTTDVRLEALLDAADYVEAFNARVPYAAANVRAAEISRERGIPGVAASDAHTLMEVGVAYTRVERAVDSAEDLRAALEHVTLVTGRASLVVRGVAPAVKLIQRVRGNRPLRGTARRAPEARA